MFEQMLKLRLVHLSKKYEITQETNRAQFYLQGEYYKSNSKHS